MAWTGSIAIGSGSREIIECMPDGKIVNVPTSATARPWPVIA
jgi:hypothetical protein